MKTFQNAGVFGLIATPTLPSGDSVDNGRQLKANQLGLKGVPAAPGTRTGSDLRRGAMRSVGFFIAASVFGCLFLGMALAGAVLAKSCNDTHRPLASQSAPAR